MKAGVRIWIGGLVVCLCTFGIAGCQQGTNKSVEAAPEPKAAEPATPPSASPDTEPGPEVTNVIEGADRSFIMQAEKDNMQERYLGRLAEEKSQNSDVKDYGKLLSHDHNAALQSLVRLMNKYGIAQPKALPEERQDAYKEVKGLSGPAFDRAFIDMMVKDHEKAVAEFQHEASAAQNKDLKDYTQDQISVLQEHLNKAKELQGKLETGNRKG